MPCFPGVDWEKKSIDLIGTRIAELVNSSVFKENKAYLNSVFNFKSIEDEQEKAHLAIEFFITDSIFCLHEIIKLVRIYGVTYMVNYSIIANAHSKMGDWCNFYYSYFRNVPSNRANRIRETLKTLIGVDNLQFIGTRYHYEKAREAYYSLLELHREGKAYRTMIENMFYLNDDFDDTIYQFNAAAERHRINTEKYKRN